MAEDGIVRQTLVMFASRRAFRRRFSRGRGGEPRKGVIPVIAQLFRSLKHIVSSVDCVGMGRDGNACQEMPMLAAQEEFLGGNSVAMGFGP